MRGLLWPRPPGRPAPLPGRPPAGSGPAASAAPVRAVCCSGGGIRAAAFCLGGLQELGHRREDGTSWYDGVDLVTAVSGGSYIAASQAMVNHGMIADGTTTPPPYAPGSPEDVRLRAHTRYLVEDARTAALGVLSIVYGLVLNLLPILAGLYIAAKLLGLVLGRWDVLEPTGGTDGGWRLHLPGPLLLSAAALGGLALLGFGADRVLDIYRRRANPRQTYAARAWTLRLLVVGACLAVLFGLVPWLMYLIGDPLSRGVTVGGATVGNVPEVSLSEQLAAFTGLITAIVALVKGTLGRFKAILQTAGGPLRSKIRGGLGKVMQLLSAWLGSLVAAALLAVAFVVWTTNAVSAEGHPAGQLWGVGIALAIILGWQAVTDVNRNSVHAFYRERLSSAYAVGRIGAGSGADELPYDKPVRFSEFHADRPQLVVCAAVNTDQPGVVPTNRRCAPFTFSPRFTGISSGQIFDGEPAAAGAKPPLDRMLATAEYERRAGQRLLTLPAAVAVSGAAVSPVMGRMTRAPLRLLLGLANVRLGLWLPNPAQHDGAVHPDADQRPRNGLRQFRPVRMLAWQWRQPGIRALLAEALGRTRLDGRWIYVTDGGHYENLGLVEALRRGATEVIVFDATGDRPDSWTTFGEAMATARADLGVDIDLVPSSMKSDGDSKRAPTLAVRGTFSYPNGVRGRLWLCKLGVPKGVSWDVEAYAGANPNFPHESTAQQLYGDREFEAYRRLGETAARMALEPEPDQRPDRQPDQGVVQVHGAPPDGPALGDAVKAPVPPPRSSRPGRTRPGRADGLPRRTNPRRAR